MLREKKIIDEVEKTLDSYDEDPIFDANPFLLTRIKAARENRIHKVEKEFIPKINFNQILLILILLVNFITLFYNYSLSNKEDIKRKLVLELKEEFQIDQSQNNF
jgi:hypothetical protein